MSEPRNYHVCTPDAGHCRVLKQVYDVAVDERGRLYCDGCAALRPVDHGRTCPECGALRAISPETGIRYCARCELAAFKAAKSRRRVAVSKSGGYSQLALLGEEAGRGR